MIKMLELPESMEECVYFTRRSIGDGSLICWVLREKCAKCGKALMGKPRKPDGSVAIRAKEYVCPECSNTVEKQEYEDGLTANIIYTCPNCKNKGEAQIPFKRKKVGGVDTLRFNCSKCNEIIDITKKMKEKKKK